MTILSYCERRLAVHKNVNATLVPLRTSVCGLRSQQVVNATLNIWQVLSLFHTFSTCILNPTQIRSPHKNTHLLTALHKRAHSQINECTKTIVLAWMFTGTYHSGPVMCLGDRGQILCDLCGGYIAWEKGLKILLRLCRGPTITAWTITAAKELSLWQEENWAPASDSADQNNLCRHKGGREGSFLANIENNEHCFLMTL